MSRFGSDVGSSWATRLLSILSALLFFACDASSQGRVLLVGVDGATLRIAGPLLEQGELPHLGAVARSGVFGPLRSHYPISSPRIWTSIATGVKPERHGIEGFAHPDATGASRLYRSGDRRVPALWNLASDAGLSVAVINWWNTFPVEKIRGVMVSDHLLPMEIDGRRRLTGAAPPNRGAIAWPLEWDARAALLRDDNASLTGVENPFAAPGLFPSWAHAERLSARYHDDADIVRIALAVEQEVRPDLMMVLLPGIDRVSHVIWAAIEATDAYEDPLPMNDEQRRLMAAALRLYYVYTDALIGRLLEGYGADDLVLIVSDHGFEAGRALMFLSGAHTGPRAIEGLIFARGPGVAKVAAEPGISVNDVTPTVLAWLGLPLAEDLDGRVASFLVDKAPNYVPSYAATRTERLPHVPSGAEGEMIDELRALGYTVDGGAE